MPSSPLANQVTGDINNSTSGDAAPRSPMQRFLRVAGSPGRAVKASVDPGSISASTFSLVIICLGAGTLAIPFVYYSNGFILGTFDILFGGAISFFSGHLIAYCAEHTQGTCYEEIAFACWGRKG